MGGPVLINMCKHHRESYGNRTIEIKCQTKGFWDEGILLDHRDKKFLDRRTHYLQVRLGWLGPPAHCSMGKRRDSHTRERESSADTRYPQASFKKAVRKDVSFEDGLSIDCSDVSSKSMPDLQDVHEEDEASPRPRTSTVSGGSGRGSVSSREAQSISQADTPSAAADLMKRTGRRNSMPDLNPATAPPLTTVQTEPHPRVKAYSIDDAPVQPRQKPAQQTLMFYQHPWYYMGVLYLCPPNHVL